MKHIGKLFKSLRNVKYKHVENSGSFWYSQHKNNLTIFFEWSNGKEDWKNNFDFPAKPYRDMQDKWYAHRGFLKVWKSIEPYLKDIIMCRDIENITIAGYSHGGAIALLCHEYCAYNRPDCNIIGWGFGAPRVIWGIKPQRLRNRLRNFRVIRCGKDIVTHLPPIIFGFTHANKPIEYACDKNAVDCHRPESYIGVLP